MILKKKFHYYAVGIVLSHWKWRSFFFFVNYISYIFLLNTKKILNHLLLHFFAGYCFEPENLLNAYYIDYWNYKPMTILQRVRYWEVKPEMEPWVFSSMHRHNDLLRHRLGISMSVDFCLDISWSLVHCICITAICWVIRLKSHVSN